MVCRNLCERLYSKIVVVVVSCCSSKVVFPRACSLVTLHRVPYDVYMDDEFCAFAVLLTIPPKMTKATTAAVIMI
jgi:hypothetical protein